MSTNTRRHIISAGVTFVAAFLLAVSPIILEPSWTYTGRAALFALLAAGVRAGVKSLWEKYGYYFNQ